MEKERKVNSFEKLLSEIPGVFVDMFIKIFIVIGFVELGYLISKTTGVGSFLILNLILIKTLIIIFIYTVILYIAYSLFMQYAIPYFEKRQEQRKKEFFQELKRELKKK